MKNIPKCKKLRPYSLRYCNTNIIILAIRISKCNSKVVDNYTVHVLLMCTYFQYVCIVNLRNMNWQTTVATLWFNTYSERYFYVCRYRERAKKDGNYFTNISINLHNDVVLTRCCHSIAVLYCYALNKFKCTNVSWKKNKKVREE